MNTPTDMRNAALAAVDYDPFATPALARVVPSTEAQREIWLAAKLGEEASLAYNEAVALQLSGPLDRAALQRALQQLVDRHDALRATFGPDGETFCIGERLELALEGVDLSALDADARAAALQEHRVRAVREPFDLEHGPLFRASLVSLAPDEHVLLLCGHHLVCDGWSWWVIVRELGALYGGASLPPAPSFADYAVHLADPADRRASAADEAWWVARYARRPPELELPGDRPRPARRSFAAGREDYTLAPDLVDALKRVGARHGASLFATLLGSFGALLGRLAGQEEVVVGIPAAAQSNEGLGDLVGHGVHLLPLPCAAAPAMPFADALGQARDMLLDALDHQRCTFGSLLRQLDVARDPGRLPLVSVLFNIDQALDQQAGAFPGLAMAFSSTPREYENFELFVNAVQEHGGLRLECQYNAGLFDAATVRRWLAAYEALLRAAVAAPQTTLGELPLLDAAARDALVALQPTPRAWPLSTMHGAFERQASATPERPALRFGSQALSYRALDERANRIAHRLIAQGVAPGALVGVALERGPDMLAALLGTLKAGAGYVPLDPGFPTERLAYMVEDAKLAALLTQQSQAARFDLHGRPVIALDAPPAGWEALPTTPPTVAIDPASTAYVIYTSGSTGRPKGVAIPHGAVANFLASMAERPGLQPTDKLLAVTTLSFDIAVLELLGPLSVGAEVVLATREQAMDGEALKALLASSGATLMQATPATWRMLLHAGWQGGNAFRALCGGEALAPDLAAALLERCGELWNLYGPTETTVWSTCARVEPNQPIHIGTPIANTTVWVLDAQRQLCPLGVPGELWIGGAGVAQGYLHRPELTAERFVADPFSAVPGARLYRTGDRGRWLANGTLEHLGRADFQIKLRGFRIEPGEIEAQLAGHPPVTQALVTVREDRPGDARLVAYLESDAPVDEAALRSRLRERLPEYMLPQHFVVLDALPLLPNGKIDRARLPAPAAAGAPAIARTTPRDELERQVAQAMAAVLGGLEPGLDDDFFEHGGHSLLAAQLTARLNRELGLALPLRTLFEAPTVARLAAAIRAAGAAGKPAPRTIARLSDRARAPLSLMQQRLWYLEQLQPGRVAYHTPSAHRLRGTLDLSAFEQALRAMVQRQPVLRTSIEPDAAGAVQHIHATLDVDLPLEDLSGIPADEREAWLKRRLDALIAQPFDLATAPLFRAQLFRLGEQEHVFFFMTHHIIWDGWSFDLLYQEMTALYDAFRAGKPDPLPPLAVEYGDFAAWQRQAMQGEELERQLAHWLSRLQGRIEPLGLPADRPRPARMSGAGATEWIELPAARLASVHALARQAGATPFMVLLTAYYVLLHRLGGQHDLIVSTPVRGRDAVELEPVMGFFVNALPLRLAVDPQAGFLDLLHAVRTVVLDAFACPDVPFEHLVKSLKLPRDESRPPLAQAMFSYQDVRQRATSWGDLQHEHLPVFQRGSADDLGLWFIEQEHRLLGGMNYNADIFDPATAVRFRRGYETLLEGALADPRQPVAELPLLPAAELAQLQRWNATAAAVPVPIMHGAFERQAAATPERPALRFGGQTLSYRALDERANRIAHGLIAQGVAPGALVGVALERGPDMLAALLGTLKAGAGYVPLDPGFPAERLAYMVEDAKLAALLTQQSQAARFDLHGRPVIALDAPPAGWQALPTTLPTVAIDPASTAYVIYTSGSTGRPKGVAIPHCAVANFLASMAERPGLQPTDKLLAVTTLSFDIAVLELLGPLSVGAEVVLATREQAMDGEALKALLASSGATLMQATPATWRMLLQAGWQGGNAFRALCGGEALAPDLAATLLERCGELWNLYGPTETTVWSTCAKVEPDQPIHIGTPIANTTVWVLDTQRQLCPLGVPGELWIGGAGVAQGYLHRPELTAERFIADPFSDLPGARLYRTGDRGRWLPNGTLEHLGRADFQIKLRGFRIEPGEIEAIAREDAAVDDAAAVVCELGASDHRLVLYVASAESEASLLPRLRRALEGQLPGYMRPQHLVRMDALPQTPNGKLDRRSLPAPVVAGIQDVALDAVHEQLPPRQRYLAGLWQELIGVSVVRPGDNFFDAGGHSLLAVELVARVRRETGVRLNLLNVVSGTLASLASDIPETCVESKTPGPSVAGRLRRLFRLG